MYRIRATKDNNDLFVIDGDFIAVIDDVTTRAIVNTDKAADEIAKAEGIVVKLSTIGPVRGKRFVLVSDELPMKDGKKRGIHISPEIEFIMNHVNQGVEFNCKGGKKYRFFPL